MPRYEYRCEKCDESFERAKPIANLDDPEPCPRCGVVAKRQLTLPAAIIIVGLLRTFTALLP